ncbi:hypothetical protein MUN46_010890 [Mesosutterella sp. AGMB02718]|uniref:Uncharacterized protein n=1 Tax=Mesosutterella faecium TaxID=2925194 RepID=A0ABT7IPY5_9BURK|nr:hypothetical protein [Mesosutterella sp. AGMB02718]MDL2060442.1 hypothetical protein [Mesosutterella sp. AGMB02718]
MHGQIFDWKPDWKGRGYDTFVTAAPVSIGGERYICEAIVLEKGDKKKQFYLHEVNLAKDIAAATLQDLYAGGQQLRPAAPV